MERLPVTKRGLHGRAQIESQVRAKLNVSLNEIVNEIVVRAAVEVESIKLLDETPQP